MPKAILRTGRLVLREWSDEDEDDLAAVTADAEVMRFMVGGAWPAEHLRDWIAEQRRGAAERGWCRWALSPWGSEDVWGFCGYGCRFAPHVELGWCLRRDLWGRGLATEAARAALQYGFGVIGFQRVISLIHSENERSKRVAEKLGMRLDGSSVYEDVELLRYAIANPLAGEERPRDPRFRRDCRPEDRGPYAIDTTSSAPRSAATPSGIVPASPTASLCLRCR